MSKTTSRVLLCCNSDIGRRNTIGFRFGEIAKSLEKKGESFDILARDNFDKTLKVKTPFYRNYLGRIMNAFRIYFFPEVDFRYVDVKLFDNFVLKTLKKQSIHYDLAHFGEYIPKSIRYLRSRGTRIFLDIPMAHYSYETYLRNQGYKLDSKTKKSEKFIDDAIKESEILIAPSLFVEKSIRTGGFKEKQVEIVPFGTDIPENFGSRDIERRLSQKKIKFIFAGNVNFRKGVNFLLEAWDKLNLENAELLICGRLYKVIRRELKNYKLKNVKFCGFVNLDDYFRKANVFVFPTLLEGSAKVVYEAMSYGLPVITTPNAGSIVEDGKSGFIIPPGEVEVLSEKMSYFYNNPMEVKRFGENAQRKSKNYTWNDYGKRVMDAYKKYINQ